MVLIANNIMSGMTVVEAAMKAGYGKGWAQNQCYTMIKTPEYQAIWNDLLEKRKANLAGTLAKITKEELLVDLAAIRQDINDIKTYGGTESIRKRMAKVKAIESIAKLAGLLEDNINVHQSGNVGITINFVERNPTTVNVVPEKPVELQAPVKQDVLTVPAALPIAIPVNFTIKEDNDETRPG